MFKDEQRYEVWNEIRQHGIRAFAEQITPASLGEAAARTGVKLAKSPLCIFNLVWLGIAAAVNATDSFAVVLTATLKLLSDQQCFAKTKLGQARRRRPTTTVRSRKKPSKHHPQRAELREVSEEAFVKARQRMPLEFWVNLIVILGEQFAVKHGHLHEFRGFRVMAMDGTRIDLPNRKSLRDHFGAAKNKTGIHHVQAQMVMLQFPFTRLPCHYRLAPVKTGEITLARELTAYLQHRDLVLLDAGYWSYQLLWAIAQRGAYFALRYRRNVNLKALRRLQPDGKDKLVRWTPKDSRGNWRKLGLPRSIDLRVVQYRVPGFRTQSLVTNVLQPSAISRDDWTRLTTECQDAKRKLLPGLYHRRWEIETTYHELKVHQGLDRHLRSHTVESIQYEVAGHIVYYLLLRWLIVEAAVKHDLDPLRLSYVDAQQELATMRPSLICATPQWAAEHLLPRLLDRIADHHVPIRPGRHYPRRKNKSKSQNPRHRAA